MRHGSPARDAAEPFFHERPSRGHVDIAGERQHNIVGAVVILEPLAHVAQAGSIKIGHRADGRVAIGVADREQPIADGIFDQSIGLVVALTFFVLDNAALFIELVLRDRAEQMAHAVAFHEQRQIERAGGHSFDIVGAVEPGRTVGRGRPGALERNIETGNVFRPAEEQVFVKMGKPGAPARFVLRSDPVIERDADNRCLAIRVDDGGQPVGQGEAFVWNIDCLDQFAQQRGLGLSSRRGGRRRRQGGSALDARRGAGAKRKRGQGGSQESAHCGAAFGRGMMMSA